MAALLLTQTQDRLRCLRRREHQLYASLSKGPGSRAQANCSLAAIEHGQSLNMWFVPFENVTYLLKVGEPSPRAGTMNLGLGQTSMVGVTG